MASAADALVAEGVDAVFTPTDNTIMTAELAIYEKFTEAGIPHYTGADSFALNGAFLGYGVDYANLGVETADMVVDILVNGKKINIPSYLVKPGDVITVTEKGKSSQRFKDITESTSGRIIADWIDYNADTMTGTIKELPNRDQIDVPVNEMLIVELYSK